MNAREAGGVLVTMQAAWPGFAKDDIAVNLWLRYLERQDRDIAEAAAAALIESIGPRYQPGPTIAEWQDACRTTFARLRPAPKAIEPGGVMPYERFVERITRARDELAEKRGPLVPALVGVLKDSEREAHAGYRPVQCEHPAWNTGDGARICAFCGTQELLDTDA